MLPQALHASVSSMQMLVQMREQLQKRRLNQGASIESPIPHRCGFPSPPRPPAGTTADLILQICGDALRGTTISLQDAVTVQTAVLHVSRGRHTGLIWANIVHIVVLLAFGRADP